MRTERAENKKASTKQERRASGSFRDLTAEIDVEQIKEAFTKQARRASGSFNNLVVQIKSIDPEQVKEQILTTSQYVQKFSADAGDEIRELADRGLYNKYTDMAQAYVSKSVEQIFLPPKINQGQSPIKSNEEGVRGSILEEKEVRDTAEDEDAVDNIILEGVNYDRIDDTALFKLIEGKDWQQALLRLQSHPEEASTWIYRCDALDRRKILWRMLPIHRACYPVHIYDADEKKIVCGIVASTAIFEELLRIYPESAEMKDDEGKLPLHLCCRNGAPIHLIQSLLETYPNGISKLDGKGRTCFKLAATSETTNKFRVLEGLTAFMSERRKTLYGGVFGQDEMDNLCA